MGLYLLGGLAAVLALWFMVQSAEGLGYAFPRRPSVLDTQKSHTSSGILLTLIIVGLAASFVVPLAAGQPVALSPFHIVVGAAALLPIWEMMTADGYRYSFVIVNAAEETARPALVAAIDEVFGTVIEDKDRLIASDYEGDDFQLRFDEKAHLIVVEPVFDVPPAKVHLLLKALQAKLKDVKAPGFNERGFWFAFALPLALTAFYAVSAYFLLNPTTHPISLRGTIGML